MPTWPRRCSKTSYLAMVLGETAGSSHVVELDHKHRTRVKGSERCTHRDEGHREGVSGIAGTETSTEALSAAPGRRWEQGRICRLLND